LPRPLRADVHGGFHSIGTDPMVALSFLAASLTYQYSVNTLIQPIGSLFRGPTLNESTSMMGVGR